MTVYHRTSERNAQAIERQGFKPRYNRDVNPGYRQENSQYAFVTRRPNAQRGYGDALIKIRVRRADLQRDPYSGHYRIPVAKIKRQNISRGT